MLNMYLPFAIKLLSRFVLDLSMTDVNVAPTTYARLLIAGCPFVTKSTVVCEQLGK